MICQLWDKKLLMHPCPLIPRTFADDVEVDVVRIQSAYRAECCSGMCRVGLAQYHIVFVCVCM